MSQKQNQEFEQNNNTKKIKNISNSQNYLNDPFKKLPEKKFKINKNKEPNLDKLNLLFFENNNITGRKYFEKKRKEEKQKKLSQNNQNDNLNNQQPLNLIKQNHNNIDNINDLNDSRNSSFSLEFSYFEEEEEKKKEREEIIKNLTKETDGISFINFDIFDYSKMMLDDSEIFYYNKIKKDINKNIDHSNSSTHTTDKSNSKIELIKKAKKPGLKNNDKRINNFKRNIKKEIIDKSESIKRKRERSRSR